MTDMNGNNWAGLCATPVFGLLVTVGIYAAAVRLHDLGGRHTLANPVMVAIAGVSITLLSCGIDYPAYFQGAELVHVLLGPATVALAIPLFRQVDTLMRALPAIATGLAIGCVAGAGTAIGLSMLVGLDPVLVLSLAPKSATAAISMGVSERIGGIPELTAALVIMTGVTGAVIAAPLTSAFGLGDERATGFAAGIASHGIATARMFQIGETAGTFSGLAMGLNGVLTAVIVPLLVTIMRLG
jgi:putative effector of murein hydrolase